MCSVLKQEIRHFDSDTFEDTIAQAEKKENADLLGELEDGPSDSLSVSKIKSANLNLHAAKDIALAATSQLKKEKIKMKNGEINPESFKVFQHEMGPEITDVDIDELVK